MKSLRAQVYLWFKKRELKRDTSVLKALETAADFWIHLPKTNPVFALPAVAALKHSFHQARFWGIGWEPERVFLALSGVFDELVFYATKPKLFSQDLKNLDMDLKKKPGVFIDFNRPGSPELALLSQASLRWGFFNEGNFPFFNLQVRETVECDEFERSAALIASFCAVKVDKSIPFSAPVPKKRNPIGVLKSLGEHGRRLVVADGVGPELAVELKNRFDATIVDWTKLGDPQTLSTVVSNCDLYLGGPSLAFEFALAFRRPILLLQGQELKFDGCDFVTRAESGQMLDQFASFFNRGKTKRE